MDPVYDVGEVRLFIKTGIRVAVVWIAACDGRIQDDVFLGVCIHSSVFMVGYYDTKIRTIGEIQNY